jgi:hypothetical protein
MTLIELSVIVVVSLTLLGMVFIGVRSWKRGADRVSCVMNIYQTQMAVRSLANMSGLAPGTDTASLRNPIDVKAQLVGTGGYLPVEPKCPGSGTYQFGGNKIPRRGELYLSCSLAEAGQHVPNDYQTW